ncbi:LANO_0H12640g1_1 [Lachancea nothofagi CBS 11611]|uniref:LANO_0H12640g1_1 n=1 Tax=Lachancea nothofagi CBS 11611 TaxID=1266666 RepID=A0A1G4KM81_9SACH|nr:LANO_0H12640g1_1 [Lachancea nothofagi CBS 11611]
MSNPIDFLGGFVKGTKIMMASGERKSVDGIKVGDFVMKEDGTPVQVVATPSKVTDTITIHQATNHTAHLKDPTRSPPWGVFGFTCAKRQSLKFETYQVKKDSYRSNGKRVISIHQLTATQTRDGREIVVVKNKDKLYKHAGDEEAANEYISKVMGPYPYRIIDWECEVGDLDYLTGGPRTSTDLSFYPLNFENPVLLPWLENHFSRAVSTKEIEGMSWLLGFWVGDGYRRGPIFALHNEDNDVNGRLRRNGALWGMDLIIKKVGPESSKKATGYLHTYTGTLRNLYHKSPICEVLSGLGFWENGRRGAAKRVPMFLSTDQVIVREAFLAGLIDSDGCCRIQNNCLRAKIVTALPPVRDAISAIGRSLGLNVTVYFYHERIHKLGYHESDAWTFNLFGGPNLEILQSILNRCSCERKRDPPIQYEKASEEFESQEDRSSRIRKEMLAEEDSEEGNDDTDDTEDALLSEIDEMSLVEAKDLKVETPDTYFDGQQGDEHKDIVLNPNRVRFTTEDCGEKEVFGLICSTKTNLLTGDQIVVGSSRYVTGETTSRPEFAITCLSCKCKNTIVWCRVPWDRAGCHRVCHPCARAYTRSKLKCYKTTCNHILKPCIFNLFRSRDLEKRTRINADGTSLEGYPCKKCVGGIYVSNSRD